MHSSSMLQRNSERLCPWARQGERDARGAKPSRSDKHIYGTQRCHKSFIAGTPVPAENGELEDGGEARQTKARGNNDADEDMKGGE